MTTVTKLKAAVNNKNLPVLGEDGNIYSYYVGRYMNKMSELGYTLTSTELQAVNTFINDGISDGWIDKVVYFMPFIGTETTPLQGMVPLIDNVANYELAVNSVGNIFSFENGKIKSFGGSSNCIGTAEIPVTNFDLGTPDAFSTFINVNYLAANGDDKSDIKGSFASAQDSENIARFSIRKGKKNGASQPNSMTAGRRLDEQSEINFITLFGTDYIEDAQLGIFAAIYNNPNDSINRKTYAITKGSNTPAWVANFIGNVTMPKCTYVIGSSIRSLTTVTNCMAFLKPHNITESDMYNFNQAVFALTTALGRDIPTT